MKEKASVAAEKTKEQSAQLAEVAKETAQAATQVLKEKSQGLVRVVFPCNNPFFPSVCSCSKLTSYRKFSSLCGFLMTKRKLLQGEAAKQTFAELAHDVKVGAKLIATGEAELDKSGARVVVDEESKMQTGA